MPDSSHDRVYSEEEIGRILKRAADLQGKQSRRPVLGLTLPELQQLAHESDIDPAFIEAAALELAGVDAPDAAGFWGGPLTLTIRRRIRGTVSEDAFNRMVSEARQRFKKAGKTSMVGATREWSTENERDASASFSLREREGFTELELFWTESEILPIPFFVLPIVLTVMSLPVVLEGLEWTGVLAAATILLWFGVLLTGSRSLFRSVASRHRRQVREFGERLVAIAEQEQARSVGVREPGSTRETVRTDASVEPSRGHDPRIEVGDEDAGRTEDTDADDARRDPRSRIT